MADGKPQPCRHGCGKEVFTSDRDGKWKPYNVDNDMLHNCPNNPYKQKTSIPNSSGYSAFKKNDALGKIAELETDISDLRAQLYELQRVVSNQGKALAQMSYKKASEVVTEE